MQIKAIRPIFIPETGETVAAGHLVELEDGRAQALIDRGVAEKVTKTEAKQIAKQQEQEAQQ